MKDAISHERNRSAVPAFRPGERNREGHLGRILVQATGFGVSWHASSLIATDAIMHRKRVVVKLRASITQSLHGDNRKQLAADIEQHFFEGHNKSAELILSFKILFEIYSNEEAVSVPTTGRAASNHHT
jgi:hypothetical protein